MQKTRHRAEESQLSTAQRLTNLIAVFCILSWRVFWMTMLNRSAPDAPPTLALTRIEIALLDQLVKDRTSPRRKTLGHYLIKRLGSAAISRAPMILHPATRSCGADCRA